MMQSRYPVSPSAGGDGGRVEAELVIPGATLTRPALSMRGHWTAWLPGSAQGCRKLAGRFTDHFGKTGGSAAWARN